MHAFIWDCVRARTKLGMAMAANSPMMATTIMISTSVKPDLFDALIFILTLCFSLRRRELSNRRVIISSGLVHELPVAPAVGWLANRVPRADRGAAGN